MESIDIFSLATHEGPYESWPATTDLYVNGRPSGARIPGYVLDAQYRCGDRYLLAVSYDCPFEEMFTFLLLSPTFKVLGRKDYFVVLGVTLDSIGLVSHESIAADTAVFHCDNGRSVLITVRSTRPFGIGSLLKKRVVESAQ